MQGRVIQVQQN